MYKINKLLKQKRQIFHTQDLGILWNTHNKNTLYTTIKRYLQKEILYQVHKGLYSTVPLNQLNPVSLGIAHLHAYAYLSTESVLFQHGVISQPSQYITLISNRSSRFSIGPHHYRCRQLNDKSLYNNIGVDASGDYPIASPERAVTDLLYFNPRQHLDGKILINWPQVTIIKQALQLK